MFMNRTALLCYFISLFMQSFTENFNVFEIYLRIYSHKNNEYLFWNRSLSSFVL